MTRPLIPMLAAVAVFFLPALGAAQQDAPPPADRSSLRGLVMDDAAMPVVNAEVVVLGRRGSVRTDSAGRFHLENLPEGRYDVVIRRLGFISATFEWPAHGGVAIDISVTLVPLPQRLDPVVVSERESKALTGSSTLVGAVADPDGSPIGEVEVQLLGSGRRTTTGRDGRFVFRRIAKGEYTVASRRLGYGAVTRALYIPADDERELLLIMQQLPQTLDAVEIEERSGFGNAAAVLRDLDMRLRWFGGSGRAVILGPGVLSQYQKISLKTLIDFRGGLALQQLERMRSSRGSLSMDARPLLAEEPDNCILLDGARFVQQPISFFSADEVERVEYYPAGSELTGTLAPRMRGRCAAWGGRHPPYYVVWLKPSAR
jgi:hypothetical protein